MVRLPDATIFTVLLATPALSAPIMRARTQVTSDGPLVSSFQPTEYSPNAPHLSTTVHGDQLVVREYGLHNTISKVGHTIAQVGWIPGINTVFNVGGYITGTTLGGWNTAQGIKRFNYGVEAGKAGEKMAKDHHAEDLATQNKNHAAVMAAIHQACAPKPPPGTLTATVTVTHTVTDCHNPSGTGTNGKRGTPNSPHPAYPTKDHIARTTLKTMVDVGDKMVKERKKDSRKH